MTFFLNYMGKSIIPLLIIVVTTSLHFLWCYIFISVLGLSIRGAAYAYSLTHVLNMILLTVLINFQKDIKEAWFFINKDSFKGLKRYLSFAIPSVGMLALEAWTFQIVIFMSAYLSIEETAA